MSLAIDALLALYASGRTDGIVLDSGHGVTHAVPCTNGFAVPNSILRLDLAGSDLSNHLGKLLSKRGYSFTTAAEQDALSDIKEKLCYVAADFESALKGTIVDKEYVLPDGTVIKVGNECFQCTEALFKPQFAGLDSTGLHQKIFDSIAKCSADVHESMYSCIVLSGGNTMFPGITDRLQKELEGLVPLGTTVKIYAPPTREHSAWIGGSILASLPTFSDVWITKQAYEETGPSIASRIE
jgi:actin-related protein